MHMKWENANRRGTLPCNPLNSRGGSSALFRRKPCNLFLYSPYPPSAGSQLCPSPGRMPCPGRVPELRPGRPSVPGGTGRFALAGAPAKPGSPLPAGNRPRAALLFCPGRPAGGLLLLGHLPVRGRQVLYPGFLHLPALPLSGYRQPLLSGPAGTHPSPGRGLLGTEHPLPPEPAILAAAGLCLQRL